MHHRRYKEGLFRKAELIEVANLRAEVDVPKPVRPTPDAS